MSVQVRRRREAATFLSTYVGAQGELLVDTTNNRVQVHDGTTPGGWPAAGIGDLSGRNAILNGNFAINQRGYASATALAASAYGHDRWKAGSGGCTYTFTQAVPDTTVTITAGTLIQAVESLNVYATTWWLTWTGTAKARVWQGSASGSFSSGISTVAGGMTVNGLLVTGLTVGTVANIEFGTGTLGLVQFEAALPNAGPTRFERRQTELSLCQRYFEKSYGQGVAPGTATQAGCAAIFTIGLPSAAYIAGGSVFFRAVKRAIPAITFYSALAGTAAKASDVTNSADVAASLSGPGDAGFTWYAQSSAAASSYNFQVHWTANAEL